MKRVRKSNVNPSRNTEYAVDKDGNASLKLVELSEIIAVGEFI
ncbi:hypothetical protein [Ekhidna sp.]